MSTNRVALALVFALAAAGDPCLSSHVTAQGAVGQKKADASEPEQTSRKILARFDQGDPGWKVRMESLPRVVKAGPGATPYLVDALKNGAPSTREFAAQALVLVADPSARSALEQTVTDSNAATRMYAIQALSMLGPLAVTEQYERILKKDPSFYGVRPMLAAALARDDKPDPAGLR
ncbi:MAG: HEAT repeat domain-containing protein, partial [Gemmataceae bacterium]|nr:HEAT repeat domain-containing protein [Gemmataceae bacterium]